MKKGDIVYVMSNKKHDKKWLYGHVAGSDHVVGLVPARVLHKESDVNHVNEDGKEFLLNILMIHYTRMCLDTEFCLRPVKHILLFSCRFGFKRTRQIKVNSQI